MYKKANIVLFFSFVGVIFSYPLRETGFWGGLFFHGFLAGFIGSLADWFAVTALFQKPLGISYRTQIIKNNRYRLEEALVDFLGKDLLSSKQVLGHLQKISFGDVIRKYFKNESVQKRCLYFLKNILQKNMPQFFLMLDEKYLSKNLASTLNYIDKECLLKSASNFLTEKYILDKIVVKLLNLSEKLYFSASLQGEILNLLEDVKTMYVKDSMARAMMFEAMDLSAENFREKFNGQVQEFFATLSVKDSELHEKFTLAVKNILVKFIFNVQEREKEEFFTISFRKLEEEIRNSKCISAFLENYYHAHEEKILNIGAEFCLNKIIDLLENQQNIQALDRYVAEKLANEVTANHTSIIDLIKKRLHDFSDDDLVHLARKKLAADLQMIRINGAIVGSIVGSVLYTLVFLVERGHLFC